MVTRARYAGITRRLAAFLLITLSLIFAFNPLLIPIQVSKNVSDAYNVVESLKPGDIVFYDWGYGGRLDKMGKATQEALIRHLIAKDVRIIYNMISAITVGDLSFRANMLRTIYGMNDYQNHPDYGTKFVSLLYLFGFDKALMSVAEDVWGTYRNDEFGTPFSELPIMADIRTGDDIDAYVITMHTILNAAPAILGPYGVKILACTMIIYETQCEQLYRVDLIHGYIAGVRMGGEYSVMRGVPSIAMSFISTYLFSALVAYLGWIVTNYLFVVLPMGKKEET